ncbi:MAG TPA: I78 family peptidase inhibitor [Xanthomonadaceae bacterium]|nr:I78 family peptidase inhibitor [Xanthomonadaceae bacterium]
MAFATAACTESGEDMAGAEPADTAAAGSIPLQLPEEPTVTEDPPMRRMPGSNDDLVRCNPDAARSAIGKEATAEVVEQARIAAGADVARTLSPGQMVTMEFHNSRLNLSVDAGNVVVDVSCG